MPSIENVKYKNNNNNKKSNAKTFARARNTVKFPKIFFKGPFWGAYFWRGLYSEELIYEGKFVFQIDWASLTVGSKFTVFALFYFVVEGNFPSTSPRGGLYLEGRFNGGFFALPVWGGLYLEGLLHGGAYFRNFTVTFLKNSISVNDFGLILYFL